MKQRQGFVSNSSSSSFIIGLGVVPAEHFQTVKREIDVQHLDDIHLYKVSDLMDPNFRNWELKVDREFDDLGNAVLNRVEIESFTYDSVILGRDAVRDLSDEDYIIVLSGSEGDECDFWDEDSGEYDYDIVDYDWFSEGARQAMDLLTYPPILFGDYSYGAGRNG